MESTKGNDDEGGIVLWNKDTFVVKNRSIYRKGILQVDKCELMSCYNWIISNRDIHFQ